MQSKGTHSTHEEQFDNSYVQNAHLQKGFNTYIVQNFVDYILINILDCKERKLKILDLCCGDGGVTAALLDELQKAGVLVEKMVGYDISQELIQTAKHYEKNNSALQFIVQDVNTMNPVGEYDVVISLFGLHWIADINLAADKIYQSLKPNGKLMYFVPLEKMQLFALRQAVMALPEFEEFFKGYSFTPFRDQPLDDIEAFQAGFDSENTEEISGTQYVEFPEERFKQFLASWMQEIRHLQNQTDKDHYLDTLLETITKNTDSCKDVEKTNDGLVSFGERFLWFFATKKNSKQTFEQTIEEQANQQPSEGRLKQGRFKP
jgi:ubiquinone/menaquinone biosynthesis C-methylase UbiE